MGKQKETLASREWCEWDSASDSDTAEQPLSKALRKQWQHDTGAPDAPYRGMIAFPHSPMLNLQR